MEWNGSPFPASLKKDNYSDSQSFKVLTEMTMKLSQNGKGEWDPVRIRINYDDVLLT